MERPSHIHLDTQSQAFSRRLPFLVLALCLQATTVWLLAHELINHRVITVLPRWIDVVPLPDKPDDSRLPPPPDPVLSKPDRLTAVNPIFDTAPGERPPGRVEPRQPPDTTQNATLVLPDRGPIGIASTHTVPPYPPIARRIGAEGKVTLRLTVTAEGRVSAAEVVTSSGRDDLDQTAQQWILAHWIYKPALTNGVPVASKLLATVTFSLTSDR